MLAPIASCARALTSRQPLLRSAATSPLGCSPATTTRARARRSLSTSASAMASTVLGTMTMGWNQASETVDEALAGQLLDAYLDRRPGYVEVDTAIMYSKGETEKILGRLLAAAPERASKAQFAIKANPWHSSGSYAEASGGLAPALVREQVETSLASLGISSAEILYLHAPDPKTAIEDTLGEVHRLHKEGKFKVLGLSNYAAWEVVNIHALCAREGYVLPTVYQGMYNVITRQVEEELLPALNALDIRFLVYNPLAAGMLTGKHKSLEEVPSKGRFTDNPMYQQRFWKAEIFQAVDGIRAACDAEGLPMVDASMKWLRLHSKIVPSRGDGVIIGASSLRHLEDNLAACEEEAPLPTSVLEAMDKAWAQARPACPSYFRGCSKY